RATARQRRHSPAQGAVTEPVARIPPCTDSSRTSTTTVVPSGTQLPVTASSGMGPSRRSRRLAPGWRRRVATLTTNGCSAIFLAPVSLLPVLVEELSPVVLESVGAGWLVGPDRPGGEVHEVAADRHGGCLVELATPGLHGLGRPIENVLEGG